ncbi:MAG: hypothetical protein BGN96_12140 [Bacteroidales bacterium 45-6]|nr:MAG: hypothetical protein BGN96_12140 [Bacteroidales bacterium 45-6]
MQRKKFKVGINAPPSVVYDKMLGIRNKNTYHQWAKVFDPSSRYEGSWEEGSKIRFVGESEEGTPQGIFCVVTKNVPSQYLSMRTQGLIENGVEITDGAGLAQWQNLEESYHYEEADGLTMLTVEVEIPDDYVEIFSSLWPKALDELKSIVEEIQ